MRSETKKTPVLRFPEFSASWKHREIGDVVRISSGGTPNRGTDEYWNGNIPWVTTTLVDFRRIVTTEEHISELGLKNSSAKKFPVGTVLLAMYGQGKTRGKVGILGIEATTNQACAALMPDKEQVNELFLFQNLAGRYSSIRKLSNSGGQDNLSAELIRTLSIAIPSLDEQRKIAAFLSAVDERIGQLAKKKELLLKYKKRVMWQIFDQKIRFKNSYGNDFSDWQEKTLGEVSSVRRGASPRPISDKKWFDDSSSIGWVRISDVTRSNKFLLETEQYLSPEGVAKSRLVSGGNLIMSICATIGKPIYTTFDVCIHDGFVVFSDLSIDKEYLYYYLDLVQLRWYRYGQPGTQVNLNSDIVAAERIPVPCIDEQRKIVSYFSALDRKINLADKQLDLLKTFKKALLQQMFV